MMARPGRQLAVAHFAQFTAQCLPRDGHPELLPDPLAQIEDPPTHDTVHGRNWPFLDHRRQRRTMRLIQAGRLAGRLAIDQAIRPGSIELYHPVADDLQRHATDPRRLGAACPVVDRRKRQEATRLPSMLALARGGSQRKGIKIRSKGKRHREPPAFANHRITSTPRRGIPRESHSQGLGISNFRGLLRS